MKVETPTELQKDTPPDFISSLNIWKELLICCQSVDSTWWPVTPRLQHLLSTSIQKIRSGRAILSTSSIVSLPGGPPLIVTAAARMARETKERAAPPAMTCPLPAVTASQRPALRRRR